MQLQANMDPKHRDKVALVRVCSGQLQSISSFSRCHRLLMVQSLKNVIGLWCFVPTFVAKGLPCFKDHQSKWTNELLKISFKVTIFHFLLFSLVWSHILVYVCRPIYQGHEGAGGKKWEDSYTNKATENVRTRSDYHGDWICWRW
jgi:hypothetical protein